MRLQRLFDQLYFRPWLLSTGGLSALCENMQQDKLVKLLERLAERQTEEAMQARPKTDLWGDPLPQMTIQNGVAIVPVGGVLVSDASPWQRMCGYVDYNDVLSDVADAEANPAVRKTVLLCDSPGGMAQGAPEAAAALLNRKKQMVAYTQGQMDSACYFLACAADAIYIRPSAEAGSIGTKIAILDSSEAYKMNGYKVEVFASGQFKAEGTPGTSLTPAQRKDIERTMNTINDMFTGFVKANRSRIDEDSMQGQVFVGPDATAANIADGLVGSLGELLARLK